MTVLGKDERDVFFSCGGYKADDIIQDGSDDTMEIFLKVDQEHSRSAFLWCPVVCVVLANDIFDVHHGFSPFKASFHGVEQENGFCGGFDL
jgi:hypothetical protein